MVGSNGLTAAVELTTESSCYGMVLNQFLQQLGLLTCTCICPQEVCHDIPKTSDM